MSQEEKNIPVEQQRLEKEQIEDMGSVYRTRGAHAIHCLTVIGQVEGLVEAPQGQKTTKYEHVIPQLVAVEESPEVDGLLILLNTVGGDVEAGLAIAEMIASLSKPVVSIVLGGGHSIGIPLAVAADYSFITKTATMTLHPIRTNGMVITAQPTFEYMKKTQERVVSFIEEHSCAGREKILSLINCTDNMANDVGTILFGKEAVDAGLIDETGGISSAIKKLRSIDK